MFEYTWIVLGFALLAFGMAVFLRQNGRRAAPPSFSDNADRLEKLARQRAKDGPPLSPESSDFVPPTDLTARQLAVWEEACKLWPNGRPIGLTNELMTRSVSDRLREKGLGTVSVPTARRALHDFPRQKRAQPKIRSAVDQH